MVIRINTRKVLKDTKATGAELDKLKAVAIEEFVKATSQFAEFMLGIAQERAPVKTGALRASGTVTDPIIEGKKITIFFGFNLVYARIQDFGGEIFAKPGSALFIPLRPGVVPIKDKAQQKASGQKQGIDFVLVQSVIINGNDYFTDTVDEQKRRASRAIGKVAFQNIKRRMTV